MKLTVIGCSGTVPAADAACSCYLVGHDGFHLLLDLGHGAFGALQRHLDPAAVDAVLFSHLHADHWHDYQALRVWRAHGPCIAPRPLTVLAPTDGEVIDAEPWQVRQQVGPFEVTTVRAVHPVQAYAIRLDADGRSLTYTGDTATSSDIERLARGSDVLLAEASYVEGGDHPPGLHLTGREAGELAAAAEVGRLVVTHVPPWHAWDEAVKAAGAAYDGPVLAAAPGLVLDV